MFVSGWVGNDECAGRVPKVKMKVESGSLGAERCLYAEISSHACAFCVIAHLVITRLCFDKFDSSSGACFVLKRRDQHTYSNESILNCFLHLYSKANTSQAITKSEGR